MYAVIHNAWDTFLNSHQTVEEYYKLLMQYGRPDETELFLSGWQADQYGWLYLLFTMLILAAVLLMVRESLKNCEKLPKTKPLSLIYGTAGAWMAIFSVINEVVFMLLNDNRDVMLNYIDCVSLDGDMVDIRLNCFGYYALNGIWKGHPQTGVMIVVLSVAAMAVCVCLYRKRHSIFRHGIRREEADV